VSCLAAFDLPLDLAIQCHLHVQVLHGGLLKISRTHSIAFIVVLFNLLLIRLHLRLKLLHAATLVLVYIVVFKVNVQLKIV
jgi:hypothetical protein